MNTILDFTTEGTFYCDGLAGVREVHIGGPRNTNEPGCETCERFVKCGMSHTATVATKITDLNAIKEACKMLKLPAPVIGTHKMYDGKTVTGVAVRLENWQFPIVIDTKTGEIHYDNYHGNWGSEEELKKFKQHYGVAKAKLIAKKQGYFVKQFTLPNGTIRLQVTGM